LGFLRDSKIYNGTVSGTVTAYVQLDSDVVFRTESQTRSTQRTAIRF